MDHFDECTDSNPHYVLLTVALVTGLYNQRIFCHFSDSSKHKRKTLTFFELPPKADQPLAESRNKKNGFYDKPFKSVSEVLNFKKCVNDVRSAAD